MLKRRLHTRSIPSLGILIALFAFLLTACQTGGSEPASDSYLRAASENIPSGYEVTPRIRGDIEPAAFDENAVSSVELPALRGSERAVITYAPQVPPRITRDYSTRVVVDLETTEEVKELADGVKYMFWTFGGEVPGPFIRVRQGDLVELNLSNHPSSTVPHNIDLHAVSGTGGGAEATLVIPGKTATFEFRALNPGLYVYHCATSPVGLHVANGMYGLILVEPAEGLPAVDREYYVLQSEFYTQGAFNDKGYQPFDMDKALAEQPEYVVFNGQVGALTGDGALQAAVGETVRLYLGNGGPNLISSFHVIGEVFDRVYGEGGTVVNQKNVQTTLIPAGGSAIVEFQVDVPGTYTLVDHSIFRAINKGAVGLLKVVGPENLEIFNEHFPVRDYRPESDPELSSTRSN